MNRLNQAAGLFAVLCLSLAGCKKEAPPVLQRPTPPVSVTPAIARSSPVYLDEVGRAVAREAVSVTPQVSGRITEMLFTDGADVKKGDRLFTIDPRPFQAQLNAAEANLAQAKAALELAKTQFARVADLVDSRAIARQDYDTRKNTVTVDEAQVAQAQAAIETAKLNLEYTSIRSPIDGRAGHRLIDIGNIVTANTTAMLSIQRLDPIYTDFAVTENDMSAVQRSMKRGALRVEVTVPEDDGPPVTGPVTFVDNAVQDATGTLSLRATLANGNHRLWPGRFVKVKLVLDTAARSVQIPAAAPQLSAMGSFVYVVKGDSTAELRNIKLGQRQGEMIVVEEGLAAGEQVIVLGQLGVMPGIKVKIVEPSIAPAAGSRP